MNYTRQPIIGNRDDDPPQLPAPDIATHQGITATGMKAPPNENNKPGRIKCLTCPRMFDSWCVKRNRVCGKCRVLKDNGRSED